MKKPKRKHVEVVDDTTITREWDIFDYLEAILEKLES